MDTVKLGNLRGDYVSMRTSVMRDTGFRLVNRLV